MLLILLMLIRLYLYGVIPFITRISRISNNSATLIDYILTDLLLDQDQSLNSVLLYEITDHYPIFRYIQEWKKHIHDIALSKYYSVTNGNEFISMTSNIDWSYVLQCNMTQNAFSLFYSRLRELHEKWFHMQTLKKRYNNKNIRLRYFT